MSTVKSYHQHPVAEPDAKQVPSSTVPDLRAAVAKQQERQTWASNSAQTRQLQARAKLVQHHSGAHQPSAISVLVDGKAAETGFFSAHAPASAGLAAQLAKADIDYRAGAGGPQHVGGVAVGQGATGGQTHSEQLVWARVRDAVLTALRAGRQVVLTFTVDTTICSLCTPWFEHTVWGDMRAAATTGGTTFELWAEVMGNRVQVVGAGTVWPNEIADDPTWQRLGEFERMDRLITEDREGDGELGAGHSPHVTGILESLKEQMAVGGITGDQIETCLDDAKDDAVALQVAAYDFRDAYGNEDPAAMRATLADIDLYAIMSSGRIGYIPDFAFGAGGQAASQQQWKAQLTTYFFEWLENWIIENLDDQRVIGDNPHVG